MARKFGAAPSSSGKTILCIDDQTDFLEAIASLLTRQGHNVLTASDGTSGLTLLRSQPVDLLLLDYFMPGMTAEDVLTHVWDPSLQVILLTGYASEKPPREMLNRLNIQGYCDKSRGPEEVLLWVDVGLRAASTVRALDASRQALRQILSASARPTQRDPMENILSGLISQASSILGLRTAHIALLDKPEAFVPPSSFEESSAPEPGLEALRIASSMEGSAALGSRLEEHLPPEAVDTLRGGDLLDMDLYDEGALVALRSEGSLVGVMWVEPAPLPGSDALELLTFIGVQAASMIRRHSTATLDIVSGLQSKGFWRQATWRDLRAAMRFRYPVSLTTIGLLRMDTIPDRGWDPMLEAVGRVVRLSIRGTDLAMRETDSQITILLPHTDVEGARRFGELLTTRIADLEVNLPSGIAQIEAVAGSATLLPDSIPTLFDHAPVPPGYFEHAEVQLRHRATSLLANATLAGPGTSLTRPETDWPLD